MESIKAAHTRMIDLWNARDLEGYMDMVHDKACGVLPTISERIRGRGAVREVTAQLFDATLNARIEFDELDFAEFDGVAVVTGIATLRARRRDGNVVSETSYATLTYVRDDGAWKIVAGHYSPMTAPDTASAFLA